MENEVNGSSNLKTVLETVFLFLKNQNFFHTSEVFRKECEQLGIFLPNKSGKVFFRTDEKISIIEDAKFIDQIIVLETFLQKNNNENDISNGDNIPKYDSETEGKQHLKKQFTQLREEYKNLLSVTAELTKALQIHIVGQTKNINSVLDQCKIIYPSLFEQPAEEEGEEENISNQEKSGDTGPTIDTETKECEEITVNEVNVFKDGVKVDKASDFEQGSTLDGTQNRSPNISRNSATIDTKHRMIAEMNIQENEMPNSELSNSINLGHGIEIEKNPHTPISHRQIRHILESELNKVLFFSETTEALDFDSCPNKTCKDCTNQISKILEDILVKVMLSPRCNVDPYISDCYHCETTREIPSDNIPAIIREDIRRTSPNLSSNENTTKMCSRETSAGTQSSYVFPRHSAHVKNDKTLSSIPGSPGTLCNSSLEPPTDHEMSSATLQTETMTTGDKFRTQSYSKPVRLLKFQTPLCYIEACQKATDVMNNCQCAKCVPGKSRYYCGCYDLICKEIAEEIGSRSSGSTCKEKILENLHKDNVGDENSNDNQHCSSTCRNKNCKGAFISKPRIRRTPPR